MSTKSNTARSWRLGRLPRYLGLIADRSVGSVGVRDLLLGAGAMSLIFTVAQEAVDGPMAMPTPDPVLEQDDPLLIAVGSTPIRLSDARAQAVISPISDAAEMPPTALFEIGLVDEAADQVALAEIAEARGLDQALEVRAQLALARRRILSSALLDLNVSRYVSEDQIRARYDALAAAAEADQVLRLRRIHVSSQKEAQDIRERLGRGISFAEMARRRSLDMTTRAEGGDLGKLRLSELPDGVASAVAALAVGEVSAPVEGGEGWYLLTVDSRSVLRLPPYETMRDRIEREMRDEVVARTIADARASVPIRVAGREFEVPARQVLVLQATDAGTW